MFSFSFDLHVAILFFLLGSNCTESVIMFFYMAVMPIHLQVSASDCWGFEHQD